MTIFETIQQVAAELGKPQPPLREDLHLADSGLDSLGLAVVVARLEDRLGVDPFSRLVDGAFPMTLGDFVQLYESATP